MIPATWADVARKPFQKAYDDAVIGSAVYVGRWMKDARSFLEANRAVLRRMPLWLFSSGPLGDPEEQADALPDVKAFAGDLSRPRPPGLRRKAREGGSEPR